LASKNVFPWDFLGDAQIIAAVLLAVFGFSLIFILEKSANKKTT
jgi:putative membrane protein